MTEAPFKLIELRDAGGKSFASKDELVEWLKSEVEFWSWALKNNSTDLGLSDDRRREFINGLKKARDGFASESNPEAMGAGERQLEQYARSGLVSSTARARFIEGLQRGDEGHLVAQAALAEYLGSAPDPNPTRQKPTYRYPCARGRVAIALFDAGVDREAVAAVSRSISEMSQNFSHTLSEHLSSYEITLAAINASLEVVEAKGAEAEKARSAQLTSELTALLNQKEAALKEISDTRQTYMEYMRIGAAVEYWKEKGQAHSKDARWWLTRLSWYAIIGIAMLGGAFWFAFQRAKDAVVASPATFDRIFLLETAGLAALITIMFWVARFLSRLFLSERHMAIDAQQRAVMAEAFLALSNEGKVEPADRALILQPLFRAGGDGIIKDDGGIDGILAVLARTLEKPTPGGR